MSQTAHHETLSDTQIFRSLRPCAGTTPSARILIVDDDATARLALGALMHADEYQLAFSTNAAEVRHRLASIDPDLIICDLVMDELRGDEFFRWLKAHEKWRFVPVIAVTHLDNPIVRADLLDAGADVVLAKSNAPGELRACATALLRTRRTYLKLLDASR